MDISKIAVDSIFQIHQSLGPGLLESAYEKCLLHELKKRELNVLHQKALPVYYDGLKIDAGYRIDMIINEELIIEIKAVEKMIPLYQAQLMTYLKLAKIKTGLLVNFNVPLIKNGIQRVSI